MAQGIATPGVPGMSVIGPVHAPAGLGRRNRVVGTPHLDPGGIFRSVGSDGSRGQERVVTCPRQRNAGLGQLAVAPGVRIPQRLAGQSLEAAHQCGAKPRAAICRGEGIEEALDQMARRERVVRTHLAAHRGGQRPQALVDRVEDVGVAPLQRLDRRLADQLALQLVVRHQAEGVARDRCGGHRPAAQRMAEARAPAALVGGDLAGEDVQVGQVLGTFRRWRVFAHAARQRAALGVDDRRQQWLQLREHPAPQRLDELGVRTAGAPMLVATLGLRAGHVPVLLPCSPTDCSSL